MKNSLFIGGLSHGVTNEQLKAHFVKAGKVILAKVILDKKGLGKGFGFIDMETEEEAVRAIEELNHTELDGKKIEVKEAKQ